MTTPTCASPSRTEVTTTVSSAPSPAAMAPAIASRSTRSAASSGRTTRRTPARTRSVICSGSSGATVAVESVATSSESARRWSSNGGVGRASAPNSSGRRTAHGSVPSGRVSPARSRSSSAVTTASPLRGPVATTVPSGATIRLSPAPSSISAGTPIISENAAAFSGGSSGPTLQQAMTQARFSRRGSGRAAPPRRARRS